MLAGEVTAETLESIERTVRDAANPRMRVVLVGDMVRKQHLLRAVNCGPISLIPRREASAERLLRAVTGAREGRAELSTQGAAWLLDWARTVQSDVLTPIAVPRHHRALTARWPPAPIGRWRHVQESPSDEYRDTGMEQRVVPDGTDRSGAATPTGSVAPPAGTAQGPDPARPEAAPAAVVTEVSAPDGGPPGAGTPIAPR
ncbi:hypothetical protein [Streptomyces noursei]|uniref:hypothetical protein n=1 Tax=Streptomyces noursei TaxID=1971 RepID=UPI00381A895B